MFWIKTKKSPLSAEKLRYDSNNLKEWRKWKLDLMRNPPSADNQIILTKLLLGFV